MCGTSFPTRGSHNTMAALVFFIKKKEQLSLIGVGSLSTQLYDSEEQVSSLSHFQTCFSASQN